jgi:benzoyl-CoA 2,3-dioxygenase component A
VQLLHALHRTLPDGIDRQLARGQSAYSLDEQLCWTNCPRQEDFGEAAAGVAEAIEGEVGAPAGAGPRRQRRQAGGPRHPPPSLSSICSPAASLPSPSCRATYRITAAGSSSDVRHIVLSLAQPSFPCWRAIDRHRRSLARVPDGRPHDIRLYSIASSRDGEKRNANNVSLTVKRAEGGVASNYLCDLKVGDKVQVTGPFGATFLMPNDPQLQHP